MSANKHLRRAVELAQGGDHKTALAEVKKALAIEPDHPKALVFRFTLEARLLRRAQRPGDAALRYRAVLALDPANSEALQMLSSYEQKARADGDPSPAALPAVNPARFGAPSAPGKAPPQPAGRGPSGAQPAGRPGAAVSPFGRRAKPAREMDAPRPVRIDARKESPEPTPSSDRPTNPPLEHTVAAMGDLPVGGGGRSIPSNGSLNASDIRPTRSTWSDGPLVEIEPAGRSRGTLASAHPVTPPAGMAPPDEVAFREFSEDGFRESAALQAELADEAPESLPPPSTETPLDPERRVAPRVSIEVHVGISSESNFFTGFSGDISEGGLFIATYNLLPVGAHVEVSFGVVGHEVKAHAVVCWVRDPIDINLMPGFGVRFADLTEPDHRAISGFIEARTPMFYDDD